MNVIDTFIILLSSEFTTKQVSDEVYSIGETSFAVIEDTNIKLVFEVKTSDGIYPKTKRVTYDEDSIPAELFEKVRGILSESIDSLDMVRFTVNAEFSEDVESFLKKYGIRRNTIKHSNPVYMFEVPAEKSKDVNDFILVNGFQKGLEKTDMWNGFKDWISGEMWRKMVGR